MPQLEIGDYAPQLAWLIATFILLVLLMWRVALPRVSRVLEERERRISGDLEQAEKLKREAEAAQAAYRKALADARAGAQTLLNETKERLAAEAARHKEAVERDLARQSEAAAKRIAQARAEAMANVAQVAGEVARAATAKLIGLELDKAAAEAAVGAHLARKGQAAEG